MLKKILSTMNRENENFQIAIADPAATAVAEIFETEISRFEKKPRVENFHACEKCGSQNFWKPRGSKKLICEICQPPKNLALVESRIGPDDHHPGSSPAPLPCPAAEPERITVITFGMGRPVCDQCCCQMIDEHWLEAWIDERWIGVKLLATICVVCGSSVSHERVIGGMNASLDLMQRGKRARWADASANAMDLGGSEL